MENQEELKARMVIVRHNLMFYARYWDQLEKRFSAAELERQIDRHLDEYIAVRDQLKD